MSNIFKPAFFNTEKVLDSSTISNGQFIIDIQTHKAYVDYNNQRFSLLPFLNDDKAAEFEFDSSTEGFTASQTSGFTAIFSKTQMGCGLTEPSFQLFDNNGYEIGSGSDISMRWNPITGNLEIQSITNISGTWKIKFSNVGSYGTDVILQSTTTIMPIHNVVFKHNLTNNDSFTIDVSDLVADKQVTFELHLIQPSTAVSFTLPNTLLWSDLDHFAAGNPPPAMSEADTLYCIVVRWDGSDLLANLAYSKAVSA